MEPLFPEALTEKEVENQVVDSLAPLKSAIVSAENIAIIIEDSTRPTLTAPLVAKLLRELTNLRGGNLGLSLIIAAGAHYNLSPSALIKKTGRLEIPVLIHDCTDRNQLSMIGDSKAGIPLWFNRPVVQADLWLAVSTVNIHPMVGFSGGEKILLPRVAGLETIAAFHGLPQGRPGVYQNQMRDHRRFRCLKKFGEMLAFGDCLADNGD